MYTKLKKFIKNLGPGLITGASDDDPSGIVIYSQTGAVAGTTLAWTAPLTFPFMAAVQEMCARIGLVTGHGLIGTMRRHYPRVFLSITALLVVAANTINIGADIAGMVASIRLFIPLNSVILAFIISFIIGVFMVYFPYRLLANLFKWLTLSLFVYVITAFIVVDDWRAVLSHTFIPTFTFSKEHLILIIALFGTTISPYLFFWQASEEVEEKNQNKKLIHHLVTKNQIKSMREDVTAGMFISNLIMYFIIIASAFTLPQLGISSIESVDQAAKALEPIAGRFATLLFALGIVGTGMLAIPVLAGSAAYAVSETFGWREGLSLPFSKARAFYGVIVFSTFVGFLMNAVGIPPLRMLFLTGVIYGVLSPILILAILHIANNRKVLGDKVNGWVSNTLGFATFILMTIAVVAAFVVD